ncbi:hypothetical protein EHQ81_12990 [Leptospira selangorensis]|uniref:DUF4410 domain-containing protein n=1 Tax=Leptospira selangorensis TaxID=2484982 RepID=A0A4R9GE50_9LEPT|nr:hypothetical protein [Leptospira selangorensis]TGK09755.1 hypothetical protein EHO58_05115 [Leptospira selangorensis]TGM12796.1 hypothetical protein EHQ81_12990 [Leptospira selangorensis]TGM30857.1 hypothetical protein EHQ82_00830 [Leptospira selangorensis]
MNRKTIFLIASALVMFNCAFPSTREGMRVTDFKAPKKVGDKIYINESVGGSITLPFWMSKISDEEFTAAVKESVAAAGLFETLEEQFGNNWHLKIEIVDVDRPLFGTTFTVKTKIKYTLSKGTQVISELLVDESGEATMGDALIGVKRMRLANENSARANIKKFLEEVSKVQVKAPGKK